MPPGRHLSWFDWEDFTPGLYETAAATVRKIAVPPNAAAVLTNYRPMKSGGLRAFQKGTTLQSDGATAITNGIGSGESIAGIWTHGSLTPRSGKTGGSLLSPTDTNSQEILAVTIDRSTFKMRVRRLDLSNDNTSWSQLYVDSVGHTTANHAAPSFASFNETDGDYWNVLTAHMGGQRGLYKVGYASGTALAGIDGNVTFVCNKVGPMIVHQARIVLAGQTGASPDDSFSDATLAYSSIGDIAFTSTQVVTVSPNQGVGGAIAIMAPIEPGDVLVGKLGNEWTLLSGDISSASLSQRDMGTDHHARRGQQMVPHVPGGVAFIEANGQVFITDGRDFRSISDQLDYFPTFYGSSGARRGSPGQLVYANGLLWGPRGMVYDFDTNAWFRQDGMPVPQSFAYDPYFGEMLAAGMNISETAWNGTAITTANSMAVFRTHPTATSHFSPTATVQSQPLYDKDGRNVRVREVQVFHTPHRSSATLCVELIGPTGSTIGSANSKTTGTADQPDMTSFLFPGLPSKTVAVKVYANSGGSAAAHTIEKIRVGFDRNNTLSLSAG